MCHCLLLLSREVSSELKKLTEVLEKLQHRPRDAEGRNLYDEVCYVIVYSCLITLLLLLTHREMTIYCWELQRVVTKLKRNGYWGTGTPIINFCFCDFNFHEWYQDLRNLNPMKIMLYTVVDNHQCIGSWGTFMSSTALAAILIWSFNSAFLLLNSYTWGSLKGYHVCVWKRVRWECVSERMHGVLVCVWEIVYSYVILCLQCGVHHN